MEVRAAETARSSVPGAEHDDDFVEVETIAGPRTAGIARRRPVAKPIVLTKEEEYRYIRADLRRLALTAGGLFVLMMALLFIVD